MIKGVVNDLCEATISLTLRAVDGEEHDILAIIDTGFSGYLTLPAALIEQLNLSWYACVEVTLADGTTQLCDEYLGTVFWNEQARTVEIDAANTTPLVGMELLRGHRLSIDVIESGVITIEALA